MNETKLTPTPGPWRAWSVERNKRLHFFDWNVCDANQFPVAKCGVMQNSEANARLIAAAPELLEALQGMISAMWQHWEYYHDGEDGLDSSSCNFALDKARAAIAKATGGAA